MSDRAAMQKSQSALPVSLGLWCDRTVPESLDWVPLFHNVDLTALEIALSKADLLLLPAGLTLLRPGEANQNVYIVLSGEMIALLEADGYQSAGIPIPAGQCVGEFSAIDGKPVSALVRAVSDSTVLRLTPELLWSRLILLPGVARNLMTGLTERMRLTNQLTLQAQREGLELSHLRKELHLAHELQTGMLPLHRPLFPDRSDFQVSALMEPASSVGGDLFDVLLIDDHRLFVCIGDVSGHGMGAALLMARAVGLLRMLAISEPSPNELLRKLNDRLCEGNETSHFITVFCGFLDLGSGLLRYSNAGHCAPLIVAESETRPLPLPAGALIGVFPEASFSVMEATLHPGDLLFCYTDGITEAENDACEPFSETHCMEFLGLRRLDPLDPLIDELREELRRFTGAHSLEDDATMLVVRRSFSRLEARSGEAVNVLERQPA